LSSPFRYRVLVPTIVRWTGAITGAPHRWLFWAVAGVAFFLLLIVYRRYLANFVSPRVAAASAVAIAYPMVWNYCVLNNLYFPFDVPAVLFFVLGCHLIYTRNWRAYYPVLALAVLNRETSAFLLVVMLVTSLHTAMPRRTLAAHLAAQAALWGTIKLGFYAAMGGAPTGFADHIADNVRILSDMAAFRGNGPKDLLKLVLSFGGLWLLVPWAWRRSPAFVRRAVAVMIPFLVAASLTAVIDEVRQYGELIPIVLTPVVLALAARRPNAAAARSDPRAEGRSRTAT